MGSKNLILIALIFGILLSITLIQAEMMLSQPKALYNLGEDFSIQIEVNTIEEGYFDADLICANIAEQTQNLFHGILTSNIVQIDRKLIPAYIGSLKGSCYIFVKYSGENKTSQGFQISSQVIVNLELSQLDYLAGEAVNVKGTATKSNGEAIDQNNNGFVEASLGDAKISGVIINGAFDLSLTTLETMAGGNYPIIVSVYDKDSEGNILNTGEMRADLIISQIAASLEAALDKDLVLPGDSIKIVPIMYDKAGNTMAEQEIILIVNDSEGNIISERMAKTGEEIILALAYNHAPGKSEIILESAEGTLKAEKFFDVAEYARINVEVKNGTLVITNIGNIAYNKKVEITIGAKTFIKKIELLKGESQSYDIAAPDGAYSITVKENDGAVQEIIAGLTGDAISLREAGLGIKGFFTKYPIVWIFILIIIAGVIFVMYKNNRKKRAYSYSMEEGEWKERTKNLKKVDKHELNRMIGAKETNTRENSAVLQESNSGFIKAGAITKAEHVLVLNGQKQSVAIVAIKIKNFLGPSAKETIKNAFDYSYSLKGVPCQMGDNFLIIFSPLVTKTFKNAENAIKAAMRIEEELREHNKKFKDKIDYGIGVNVGEIIERLEGDALKFTSMGVTVNKTKKIAEKSSGEVLISKEAHIKTMTDIKVEKSPKSTPDMDIFTIKRLVDNQKASKFIQDFLRRN